MPWYAVQQGRRPGVYRKYQDSLDQVRRYRGGNIKSFNSYEEALRFAGVSGPEGQEAERKLSDLTQRNHPGLSAPQKEGIWSSPNNTRSPARQQDDLQKQKHTHHFQQHPSTKRIQAEVQHAYNKVARTFLQIENQEIPEDIQPGHRENPPEDQQTSPVYSPPISCNLEDQRLEETAIKEMQDRIAHGRIPHT